MDKDTRGSTRRKTPQLENEKKKRKTGRGKNEVMMMMVIAMRSLRGVEGRVLHNKNGSPLAMLDSSDYAPYADADDKRWELIVACPSPGL